MARIKLILVIVLFFVSFNSFSQDWSFFDKLSNTTDNKGIFKGQGGIYAFGSFENNLAILPLSLNSSGNLGAAIFLAKYNYNGSVEKLKSYCSTQNFSNVYMTEGKHNDFYLCFSFIDSVQIGDSVIHSLGEEDLALVKIQADTITWFKHFKCPKLIAAGDIKADNNGDVLIAGIYSDSIAYFNQDTITVTGTGAYPFFIKIDTLGNIKWVKEVAGVENQGGAGKIKIDNHNNYYLFLSVSSPALAKFDNTNPNNDITLNYWGSTSCLVKYSSLGQYKWAFHYGSTSVVSAIQYGAEVTLDNDNNTYICGTHFLSGGQITLKGGLNFTGGNDFDYYLIKVDSTGEVVWARESESFDNEYCHDVAVNKKGEVFVLGDFGITASADGKTITSQGSSNIFLSCYDTAGNHKWLKGIGGSGYDYDNKLLIDSNDNLLVMGITSSAPAYFDNDTYTADFNNQLFIARMTPYAIGLEGLSKNETIVVYPNPSNGILQVSFPRNMYTDLSMYNNIGQQVRYNKLNKNVMNTTIDCSALASGTYFLQCSNDNEFINKKIIIK